MAKNKFIVQLINPVPSAIMTVNNPTTPWAVGIPENTDVEITKASKHLFKYFSKFIVFDKKDGVDKFYFQVGISEPKKDNTNKKIGFKNFIGSIKPKDNGKFEISSKEAEIVAGKEDVSLTPEMFYSNETQLKSNGWMDDDLSYSGYDSGVTTLGSALLTDEQQKKLKSLMGIIPMDFPLLPIYYNPFFTYDNDYIKSVILGYNYLIPTATMNLVNYSLYSRIGYFPYINPLFVSSLSDVLSSRKDGVNLV